MGNWPTVRGWSSQKARGGSFSPLQLTNLRGWWESDQGTTIVTGVSQWNDLSGNNNHLLQATGTKQPALVAAQINGLPVVSFDGVDDDMVAAFALVQPETVFVVFRQPTWTNFDMVYDGAAVTNNMSLQQATASPGLAIRAGVATVALNNNLAVGATFGLVTAKYNGASSSLQVNSTAVTTGNPGANGGAGIRVGSRGDGAANFGDVDVAGLIVMAADATVQEVANVKTYFGTKYNQVF
jgi:hypothetical protein